MNEGVEVHNPFSRPLLVLISALTFSSLYILQRAILSDGLILTESWAVLRGMQVSFSNVGFSWLSLTIAWPIVLGVLSVGVVHLLRKRREFYEGLSLHQSARARRGDLFVFSFFSEWRQKAILCVVAALPLVAILVHASVPLLQLATHYLELRLIPELTRLKMAGVVLQELAAGIGFAFAYPYFSEMANLSQEREY